MVHAMGLFGSMVTPINWRYPMSALTIKTDHKWKHFKYRYEVPAKVLASQFDYQKEDDALDGFFCYRGYWYHLDGFSVMAMPEHEQLKDWHAYAGDSYFSGIVIKVSSDGETYQVGTYLS
jgi:hypothetical protein